MVLVVLGNCFADHNTGAPCFWILFANNFQIQHLTKLKYSNQRRKFHQFRNIVESIPAQTSFNILIFLLCYNCIFIFISCEMLSQQLSQEDLDELYEWVDGLPLSRPKKNINRDFSDALMMAQTIHHYFPKVVDLHNYPGTNSIKSKMQNWKVLNTKVLSKFGLGLTSQQCKRLSSSTPNTVQVLLHEFKKISNEEEINEEKEQKSFGKENDKIPAVNNLSKVEELREILAIMKQKITSVERTIQRKDIQIKELQQIIQMGGS